VIFVAPIAFLVTFWFRICENIFLFRDKLSDEDIAEIEGLRVVDCSSVELLSLFILRATKLFRSSNINVIHECRLMFFNFMLPSEKIEKEDSVLVSNSRIVLVCCTILTYVHNNANISVCSIYNLFS